MQSEGLFVNGVKVRYGSVSAVEDATFFAPKGAITALVGPNGAGKSSTFHAIIGAIRAGGSIVLDSIALQGLTTTERTQAGVVLVPQGRQVFPTLTVRENLEVVSDTLAAGRTAVDEALERFPILRERQRNPAGVLSGGEQQMLALARALMARPKALLLDEPTMGLAPAIVADVARTIGDLAASGIAVLVAEPSIRLIRNRVDRGYVMMRGRILASAESARDLEDAYVKCMGLAA